jgi:hypothetical protein
MNPDDAPGGARAWVKRLSQSKPGDTVAVNVGYWQFMSVAKAYAYRLKGATTMCRTLIVPSGIWCHAVCF